MLHMLDTATVSALVKGKSLAIEEKLVMLFPTMVCISVMTQAELQYYLKRFPASHHLHLAVSQFLKLVQVIPWDSEAAGWYAEIRRQLAGSQRSMGEFDIMIAAHSLSAGAVLVTVNNHYYDGIEVPLILENWL